MTTPYDTRAQFQNFRQSVIEAVEDYAHSRPWRGTLYEQQFKISQLYDTLAAAHGVDRPRLLFGGYSDPDTTRSCYIPALKTIVLRGPRVSVVTALHEFAHHLGMGEEGARAYSIELFRRCFPNSFARCVTDGHVLRARQTI